MNHKWNKHSNCLRCGVGRKKIERKTFVRDRSVLIHGVWEDRPIFRYDMAWCYFTSFGKEIGFERPNCINH